MTWNYRVIRQVETDPDGKDEEHFGIHEVFYDEEGKPVSVTEEPVASYGNSLRDLQVNFSKMQKGVFSEPVLDYSIFEEASQED